MESLSPQHKKIVAYAALAVLVFFIGTVFLSSSDAARRRTSFLSSPISTGEKSGGFTGSRDASAPLEGKPSSSGLSEGVLTQRKIVKNATLSVLTNNAQETADRIRDLAARLEGFVAASDIYQSTGATKTGIVTLRVPASRFEETREEIKKIVIKVERETINAQDVTEQYIDLEAQLRNLRAQEEQYLLILKQARDVQDTLNVAQQLGNIRSNIERIQGQLQYLSRQVDLSTIVVTMTAEADVEVFGIRWRPLTVAKQSFRNLLVGLTSYLDTLIDLLIRLPLFLLWIATIVGMLALGHWIFRRIRRRFFRPFPPSDT